MNKESLTANELGLLWTQYIQNSMVVQLLRYFMKTAQDEDVKSIIDEASVISTESVTVCKRLLQEDGAPVPNGFNDEDVDLSAPSLFTDAFILTCIEHIGKVGLTTHGLSLGFSIREDIRKFMGKTLNDTIELFNHCVNTSKAKGYFVSSPQVNIEDETEYVESHKYFSPFHKRSLNTVEITHLFENTKTNLIGEVLCKAFAQTTTSKEIKSYMEKGKQISKKHRKIFANTLEESDINPALPPSGMITKSTTPVFTNRMVVFLTTVLSSAGQANYSSASTASMRYDLMFTYQRLSVEIGLYAKDGVDLMIKNSWLEEPFQVPQPSNLKQ